MNTVAIHSGEFLHELGLELCDNEKIVSLHWHYIETNTLVRVDIKVLLKCLTRQLIIEMSRWMREQKFHINEPPSTILFNI